MTERKTLLVTGASRGLGRSIALDLAARGFDVCGGVRTAADAEDLAAAGNGAIHAVQLDVTSAADIESTGADLEARTEGRGLWGVVNNAAIAHFGPLENASGADFRRIFEVNLFGVFDLTNRVLPMLREAGGRIVNISSINGFIPFPICGVYNATKAALEAMSDTLRLELTPWGIGVSVVQPGVTGTDLRVKSMDDWARRRAERGEDPGGLYSTVYEKSVGLVENLERGAAPHDDVIAAVVDALTSDTPQRNYLAGPDTADFAALAELPAEERDAALLGMWG